jgi:hypothetical protein
MILNTPPTLVEINICESRRSKFLEALESKQIIEWEDEVTHSDGSMTVHKRKLNPVFHEMVLRNGG